MSKYPTDIVEDSGRWGRIHQGHDLDAAALLADLQSATDDRATADSIEIAEVRFQDVPRVKWCEPYTGWGCDNEGEWHRHWFESRNGEPFTTAYPAPPAGQLGDKET